MSEKRRALGRGLGALIPSTPGTAARPVDVFFRDSTPPTPADDVTHGQPDGHSDGHPEQANGFHSPDRGHGPRGDERPPPRRVDDGGPSQNGHAGDATESARDDVDDGARLAPVPGATFAFLPIEAIRPNPRQPRTVFDEDELAELAASIREIGVLQPIVVRPIVAEPDDTTPARFELIMGERRLRATQLAGQDSIPAIVKDTHDDDLLRDALLENLHRSQLNPLEEAAAYQQLLDDFGCSHEELATRIGRSRPQISNTIRLLRLPPLVAATAGGRGALGRPRPGPARPGGQCGDGAPGPAHRRRRSVRAQCRGDRGHGRRQPGVRAHSAASSGRAPPPAARRPRGPALRPVRHAGHHRVWVSARAGSPWSSRRWTTSTGSWP